MQWLEDLLETIVPCPHRAGYNESKDVREAVSRYDSRLLNIVWLPNPECIHDECTEDVDQGMKLKKADWEPGNLSFDGLARYPQDLNTDKSFREI